MYLWLQAMLEDKLRETDWEVTQDTIDEQVARESYLQWLKDQGKSSKAQTSVSDGMGPKALNIGILRSCCCLFNKSSLCHEFQEITKPITA